MVEMYCTVFDIISAINIKFEDYKQTISLELDTNPEALDKFTNIDPDNPDKAMFRDMLSNWIVDASGIIDDYCQRKPFKTDEIPASVKTACVRIVGNIINANRGDRNSKVIKNDNYTMEVKRTTYIDRNTELLLRPFILGNQDTTPCLSVDVVTGEYNAFDPKVCHDDW